MMFVDIETCDCDGKPVVLTVKLDNIFFETCWPNQVRMFIVGHKEYYEKQSGTGYESFENKRYDYPLSWAQYNRLRTLMGLQIAHIGGCERSGSTGKTCECTGDGSSLIDTEELNNIKDKANKYYQEHPTIFEPPTWCDSCGHRVYKDDNLVYKCEDKK